MLMTQKSFQMLAQFHLDKASACTTSDASPGIKRRKETSG
jgi:hypothetical protein